MLIPKQISNIFPFNLKFLIKTFLQPNLHTSIFYQGSTLNKMVLELYTKQSEVSMTQREKAYENLMGKSKKS